MPIQDSHQEPLPFHRLSTDITSVLSEEGHTVTRIHNVKITNCLFPIFLWPSFLKSNDNNNDFFNIAWSPHYYTLVLIEKPHINRHDPPQSQNYHKYGHSYNRILAAWNVAMIIIRKTALTPQQNAPSAPRIIQLIPRDGKYKSIIKHQTIKPTIFHNNITKSEII